jgi:hypothetical protein
LNDMTRPAFLALATLVVATTCATRVARAEEAPAAPTRRPHAVYAELFGKGGLWGLGYDYRFGRFGAGAALSVTVLDSQRVFSLSPYASFALATRGPHEWFVHAGPQLVRVETPSPVPEWDGTSSTGVGAQLSSGWEYRPAPWLLRTYMMVTAGKGGVAPWLGVDLGWSF